MQTKTTWRRIREVVRARDNETCQYCGRRAIEGEVDHILPVSRGGSDRFDNLVWVCKACNRSKDNKTLREWLRYLHPALPHAPVGTRRMLDIDMSAAGWICDCGGYGWRLEQFVMHDHGHHRPDCPIYRCEFPGEYSRHASCIIDGVPVL